MELHAQTNSTQKLKLIGKGGQFTYTSTVLADVMLIFVFKGSIVSTIHHFCIQSVLFLCSSFMFKLLTKAIFPSFLSLFLFQYSLPSIYAETFHWVAGPWMICSSPCDGGVRYRDVACYGSLDDSTIKHYPVDDASCSADEMVLQIIQFICLHLNGNCLLQQ